MINAGDYEQRRVQKIVLCARAVPNTVHLLKPGVLVVAPGDRDDIILAASLAAMNGVPLAGLLLCSGLPPDPRIMELCRGALQGGLPVLSVATGSYDTATNLNRMNKEIPVDDRERAERVTEFVAGHIDFEWLKQRCGTPRELRLSPPAFRYQVTQRAQPRRQAHRPARGQRAAHRAGGGDLPGPRHRPLRAAGQAGRGPGGGPGAGHRAARGPGDHRP